MCPGVPPATSVTWPDHNRSGEYSLPYMNITQGEQLWLAHGFSVMGRRPGVCTFVNWVENQSVICPFKYSRFYIVLIHRVYSFTLYTIDLSPSRDISVLCIIRVVPAMITVSRIIIGLLCSPAVITVWDTLGDNYVVSPINNHAIYVVFISETGF